MNKVKFRFTRYVKTLEDGLVEDKNCVFNDPQQSYADILKLFDDTFNTKLLQVSYFNIDIITDYTVATNKRSYSVDDCIDVKVYCQYDYPMTGGSLLKGYDTTNIASLLFDSIRLPTGDDILHFSTTHYRSSKGELITDPEAVIHYLAGTLRAYFNDN